MIEGALSTKSLASLSPTPNRVFTALTTANLAAPAEFREKSNSVFSSAASPPAAPPPHAATTAAAAG